MKTFASHRKDTVDETIVYLNSRISEVKTTVDALSRSSGRALSLHRFLLPEDHQIVASERERFGSNPDSEKDWDIEACKSAYDKFGHQWSMQAVNGASLYVSNPWYRSLSLYRKSIVFLVDLVYPLSYSSVEESVDVSLRPKQALISNV